MLSQGQVGPIASTSDGVQVALRAGRLGDQVFSELNGQYFEQTFRSMGFWGANPTPVTTIAFVSGTTTAGLVGLCLTNPVSSGKLLSLQQYGCSWSTIDTIVNDVVLAVGFHASTAVTQTTPLTPRNALISVAAGVGLVASTVTVPSAPNIIMALGSMPSATTLPGSITGNLKGSVVLPPGGYALILTSAISPGLRASLNWQEMPYIA